MSHSNIKYYLVIIAILLGIFCLYHSSNFKLDASSDTLILQNDSDFQYFNYYNNIFPNKNFLVLALKSDKEIDQNFINTITKIKDTLSQIKNVDSSTIKKMVDLFIMSQYIQIGNKIICLIKIRR